MPQKPWEIQYEQPAQAAPIAEAKPWETVYQTPIDNAPDPRTASQVAIDQMQAVNRGYTLPGAGQALLNVAAMLKDAANPAMAAITGQRFLDILKSISAPVVTQVKNLNALNEASGLPTSGIRLKAATPEENRAQAEAAGANMTTTLAGTAAAKAIEALPSSARAGAKFNQVAQAVNDVPIDTTNIGEVVQRAKELQSTGSTMPKVFRDMNRALNRGTPITYSEGRDFASSAGRLSATERLAMNPPMQAQVGKLAEALKTANRTVAAQAGLGDVYDQAINEFRQVMALKNMGEIVAAKAPGAAKAAATLTALGIAAKYLGIHR